MFLFTTDDGIPDELLLENMGIMFGPEPDSLMTDATPPDMPADDSSADTGRVTDPGSQAAAVPTTEMLSEYIQSKRNKNTIKQTELSVKKFKEWLACHPRLERRPLKQISPVQMDKYIGGFLLEVKKVDGHDYEP